MSNTQKKTSVSVGLPESGSAETAEQLNIYLSSLHVLQTKLHNYPWNLEGTNFFTPI